MRKENITKGIILILLGVLFLLNNLGILHFNSWHLFWPLLLIWFGLQLLRGSRYRLAAAEHVSLPRKGFTQAQVQLHFGAGELAINSEAATDELLAGRFGTGLEYGIKEADGIAVVEMRPRSGSLFISPWSGRERNWRFGFNRDIPLSLDVRTGACEAHLDLTDLHVTELNLRTGASETSVALPAGAGHTIVYVDTGLAKINLRVPEGVAARIQTMKGFAEVSVDRNRFPRADGRYESPNYASAANKVDITISVGLGQVIVA
ncbi:MAG: LiaI-LiaF-like domain-containing protein [Anaerolineae bacterium]